MEQDQSSYAPFARMQTSRDAPNPLRPYYLPPSIGLPPDPTDANANATRGASAGVSSPSRDFRDLFSDIDYGDYLPGSSPSVANIAKSIVDKAIWNYTSVFLAQPFEVAKVVLQCHMANSSTHITSQSPSNDSSKRFNQDGYVDARFDYFNSHDGGEEEEEEEEEESDDGTPSYFTPTAPHETPSSPHHRHHRRRKPPSRSHSATPTQASTHASSYRIDLRRNDSVSEVISQLWAKEGAWGIWKGTNATFVYGVLLKTIETWTRSLLSALFNLPDPTLISAAAVPSSLGKLNILDSPSPVASLAIAVASAGIAGLILAPLDMVRTRLIITPTSNPPRTLIPNLRLLPSLTGPPSSVFLITLLHSTLPTFLSTSLPLLLRNTLRIDPLLTPTTYSLSTFVFSVSELFLKLPLETILRRGHVHALQLAAEQRPSRSHDKASTPPPTKDEGRAQQTGMVEFKTSLPVGPYKGVWGTVWWIVREEGVSVGAVTTGQKTGVAKQQRAEKRRVVRKGQGMSGLWRGWRVGFWGLVGVWGASAFGGSATGDEF